jgi:hypothetical protein
VRGTAAAAGAIGVVVGRLHAEANWRRIAEEMWPETDAPPSSALGREEASWWATRSDAAVDTIDDPEDRELIESQLDTIP